MAVLYAVDARTVDDRFPGIGRYTTNLLHGLVGQLENDERLAYLCSSEQRERLQLPAHDALAWVEATASPFGLAQQWQIPRLLARIGAAVYHSPYYLMPFRPGRPTVLTVYDLIPRLFPETMSARARLFFDLATRMALKQAAHVITISETTTQDFLKAYRLPPAKVTAIPLAAAPHFRPARVEEVQRVRERYGLSQEYVLYVGSDKPHKNIRGLLQAWRLLAPELRRAYTLVIAGRQERQTWAEGAGDARPGAIGQVQVLADVADADLPALYSGAALFVFPSYYEGFGLPIVEAMACGCPVACANRSSLPEIAGDAAALFDARAAEDIARVVGALLLDPQARAALREKGIQQAARFSWRQTAAGTIGIYRRLTHDTFRAARRTV